MEAFKRKQDVEGGQLYPGMMENPQMRWAFIRKVYLLLCIQLLISFGVGCVMFFNTTIKYFMVTTRIGIAILIASAVFTIILCLTMGCFMKKHPWNYVLAVLFTLCMSILIGVACAFKRGEIVLQAAGLTVLITVGLTLFTFWAAKRGYDFSFLGPFLLCAMLILIAFSFIRMLFPTGRLGSLIAGCAAALVFSAFIIYDTDEVIKRFDYDEYLLAATSLYTDIINIFLAFLSILDE
ncbi:OLC1v1019950C1 [Oldenlandia corymbosa var. corymbosa]|uniref:OLC1v1019950C1 n=1 Tax=Oldenlandia corymbosa var. corymbosa TaxID=529605 RepID=A0AAV1EF54_OLDCO|nr:OLC1v1019950C1 [Oldenlandia corymbosa var. corymbosa]